MNINNVASQPNQQQENIRQSSTSKHTRHNLAKGKGRGRSKEPLIEPQALLTASDYKNAGNKLCSLYRYDEALVYYTKAISENPEVAIFFSNRALCQLKLQQWFQAIQDCRRALELDPNLIKAHFFLGQALAETLNYDEALKHMQRAHELAKEKKMNFGDDITYQIRLIRRHRWNKFEEEQLQLENELHSYLIDLIKKDKETKLTKLKNRANNGESSSVDAGSRQPAASSSTSNADGFKDNGVLESEQETQESALTSKCDICLDKLETMFNNLKLQRKKREVPDYLCGKISFEIMHDPVITPSGITYDRQDIEEHLKRVGHFDPITRQPLEASQLICNLAMKEVVDAYLNENEWALYY